MSNPQYVYSSDGRRGVIVEDHDPATADRRFLRVRFDDGPLLNVPAELLELRPDGAFSLQVGAADLSTAHTAHGADSEARALGTLEREPITIPVVAEELLVETRTTETGVVRVHKRVHEREELVEQPLTRQEIQIERVAIDRVIDKAPEPRNEGDTFIIPVVEERLVVEKRLVLKEEVRVTRRRIEEPSAQRVTLRSEEVVVERNPASSFAQAQQDETASIPSDQTSVTKDN